jgi:hypothetical protein
MMSRIEGRSRSETIENMHYYFLSYFSTRKRYENDTLENDTDDEKLIHQKRNHHIENMSISIDNGTSNRKHQNHE